jgi:hypothetical protein
MHFCNKKKGLHSDPEFKLYNSHIKKKDSETWCHEALNVFKFVSSTDWDADSTDSLNSYRPLIGSKLDCGCIVFFGGINSSFLYQDV